MRNGNFLFCNLGFWHLNNASPRAVVVNSGGEKAPCGGLGGHSQGDHEPGPRPCKGVMLHTSFLPLLSTAGMAAAVPVPLHR